MREQLQAQYLTSADPSLLDEDALMDTVNECKMAQKQITYITAPDVKFDSRPEWLQDYGLGR